MRGVLGAVLAVMVLSGCESLDYFGRDSGPAEPRAESVSVDLTVPPREIGGESSPRSKDDKSITIEKTSLDGSASEADPGAVEVFTVNLPQSGQSQAQSGPMVIGGPAPTMPSYSPTPIPVVDNGDIQIFPYGGAAPSMAPGMSYNPPRSGGGAPAYSGAPGSRQVFFKHGSDRLGAGDMQVLSTAAEEAKFAPVARVRVEGYASQRTETSDPVRASILNLKESMNRAYAVSKTLIEKGVPAEKLQTTAWGDTVPAPDERSSRRVDIMTGAQQR